MLNLWRKKKRRGWNEREIKEGGRGRMRAEESREMALILSTVIVAHPEVPSA